MTKLVCAWCGVTMERPGYSQAAADKTSHGMCAACSQALALQDSGASLQRHIDTIPIPVVVVNRENTVVAANAKASELLGRKSDAAAHQPFGLIFDCVHSHLPEGCGRSIHCAGCAIRKSVAATFNTGEAQISVPATLTIDHPDQLSDAVFRITTVKKGGLVVMRVDSVRAER
jgi:hypothetical protein